MANKNLIPRTNLRQEVDMAKHMKETLNAKCMKSNVYSPTNWKDKKINIKTKLRLQHTLIKAIILYASPIWENSSATDIKSIVVFENITV